MDLTQLVTESLRRNEEFVLYQGEHSVQSASPSVLLLTPALMEPALETIKKIEHEYSLRDELDSAWAVRPPPSPTNLGRSRSCSKILAVRLSIDSFQGRWRWGGSCASPSVSQPALSRLHEKGLIHKDVKPEISMT